jgi:hypothetical protein
MLDAIASAASERKLRLFAVACWRRTLCCIADERCGRAVEIAEQYADWLVHDDVLDQARTAYERAVVGCWPPPPRCDCLLLREMTASLASGAASQAAWQMQRKAQRAGRRLERRTRRAQRKSSPIEVAEAIDAQAASVEETRRQCALLRDIFGSCFRPIVMAPHWRTRDVIDLAQGAYDERLRPSDELDQKLLSVLADALEEAGCTTTDILAHLSSLGPHVRGCWAVDLVLEKG